MSQQPGNFPTLSSLAMRRAIRSVQLPDGTEARIEALTIHFPDASPGKLAPGVLSSTYTSKPLVQAITGESLFGELAILRALEGDGWDGVWVDTFQGESFGMRCHTSQAPSCYRLARASNTTRFLRLTMEERQGSLTSSLGEKKHAYSSSTRASVTSQISMKRRGLLLLAEPECRIPSFCLSSIELSV